MRSASRQSLNAAVEKLAATTPDASVARDLFGVARLLGGSSQLLSALADATANAEQKKALVSSVLGDRVAPPCATLVETLVSGRWSEHEDLLVATEELAVRAAGLAAKEPGTVEAELFAFNDVVSSDSELELALRSKLAKAEAKESLVTTLLGDRVHESTLMIVRYLVAAPTAGRLRDALRRAAQVVADQAGAIVATVTSAEALTKTQRSQLVSKLSDRYGRTVTINSRVSPTILGGMRIEIGDEVIDGSVATRLAEVQQRLAG